MSVEVGRLCWLRVLWGGRKGFVGEPLVVEEVESTVGRTGADCRRARGRAAGGAKNSGWESKEGGESFAGGGRRGRVSVSGAIVVCCLRLSLYVYSLKESES